LILIATSERDLTSDYVVLELKRRALPFFRFNTETLARAEARFRPDQGERAWTICLDGRFLDFSSVLAGYFRRPGTPIIPTNIVGDAERKYCQSEWGELLSAALWSLGNLWLNSPLAILVAENKPRQLSTAYQLGFQIPETIITNSYADASSFASKGCSIAKPLRSPLLDEPDGERVIFTTRISALDDVSARSIRAAPFILQREIMKRFDLRVTVVGKQVFATEIDSQVHDETQTDWRRGARVDLEHRLHDLPPRVSEKCVALTKALGLRFAAIDLILDRQGSYWFLEINPNGQWAWIQNRTGQRIDRALVDELERISAS